MESKVEFDGERALSAIKAAFKSPVCPFSGHSEWQLIDQFVELRTYHGPGLVVGAPVVPGVAMACAGCGYIAMFSAIKLGLIDPEKAEEETKEKAEEKADA